MDGQANQSPSQEQPANTSPQPATVSQPPPAQQTTPASKPTQQTTDISKELIADLTVGLPKPFRLLQETLLLFRHKCLNFIIVFAIPLLLTYMLFKVPSFMNLRLPPLLAYGVYGVLSLISFGLITYGYLALLFSIKDNEENISIIQAYKRASTYVYHFWRLIFLTALIVIAAFASLIVPGIIIGVWFSMAMFIYIIEDLRGMDVLLQSKGYVEKYWIPVIGRWLFIGLFAALLCIPLRIVGLFPLPIVHEVVFLITLLVVVPIVSIFGFLVYGNLRLLRGDTSAYVNILKSTNSTKQKLDVLKSTFFKGALAGIPLVVYLLYTFVFRPFLVQGNSMIPSHPHNEIVITSVFSEHSGQLDRGDVIILQSPIDPDKKLIKRIVGLPGEEIRIQNGSLYINAQTLNESAYLPNNGPLKDGTFLKDGYTFSIPQRHYIVLGDNRADSEDSRTWGPIRSSDVIAKVSLCLWGCPDEKKK